MYDLIHISHRRSRFVSLNFFLSPPTLCVCEYTCMHTYIHAFLYVCEFRNVCSTPMWSWSDSLGYPLSPCTYLRNSLLLFSILYTQLPGSLTFEDSLVSASISLLEQGAQMHATTSFFMCVLGIWTQLLAPVQQMLVPIAPSPQTEL